jgi:PPK2 family polyphosphate:nucleotide phosphotransferase
MAKGDGKKKQKKNGKGNGGADVESEYDLKEIVRRSRKLARRYEVTDDRFRLGDIDPGDTAHLDAEDKPRARAALAGGIQALADLQDMLYAQDRWGLLLVFQAMDAAGKDGAIKHVMSGVNPQGCQVASFKVPSAEDLDHDYLWRFMRHLPERGRIGIFNRSYFEDVLVVRVHREILERQKLPAQLVGKGIWRDRYRQIRDFERHLSENGTRVRKFFLHVSPEEQKRRFLERIDQPEKNWKFSASDAKERQHWGAYMKAYEDAIRETASPEAPWYVIPADNKWFTRLVIAAVVIDAMASLDLHYPEVDAAKIAELQDVRQALLAED